MSRRDIRAARRGKQAARDPSYFASFMGHGTPMPDEAEPADWWPEAPQDQRTPIGPQDCRNTQPEARKQ